jgi:putative intracellular protease/amidase
MRIAITLFDRLTALDAVGPYEVLSRIPGARVDFVAAEPGPKRTDTRMLALTADVSFDELPNPDIIVVPGGYGTRALLDDDEFIGYVQRAHETTQWTTSVCTGSLVLAAAGILDGLEAATHWMEYETLANLGAKPTGRRVVRQGKVFTAAGVSSGIDMALELTAEMTHENVAKAIQLGIEYDPQPPFDAGSPEKAGPELIELVKFAERKRDQVETAS